MNIFFLDEKPSMAAVYHFDRHLPKMVLEGTQMLCTALRILDPIKAREIGNCYKPTHTSHPCTLWVMESRANAFWLYFLIQYLDSERQYRFDKDNDHKSLTVAHRVMKELQDLLPNIALTVPALAMPEAYKGSHPVKSYRCYYASREKKHLRSWTKRGEPDWLQHYKPIGD